MDSTEKNADCSKYRYGWLIAYGNEYDYKQKFLSPYFIKYYRVLYLDQVIADQDKLITGTRDLIDQQIRRVLIPDKSQKYQLHNYDYKYRWAEIKANFKEIVEYQVYPEN